MASLRRMNATDLLKFGRCNLDHLTETFNVSFYLEYLTRWPDLCFVMEGSGGSVEAYILGKLEASSREFVKPNSDLENEVYTNLAGLSTGDNRANDMLVNVMPWHGHITALTVSPTVRRLGYGARLTQALERVSDAAEAWFVDLFVRVTNPQALQLYHSLGYSVFRRITGYYNDNEDAFDMRKCMSRDMYGRWIRKNGGEYSVTAESIW